METTTPPPVNGSAGEITYSVGQVVYHIPGHGAMVMAPPPEPAPALRTRKIAILGFGETVKDCPWLDETWELWGMNGFWRAAEADFGIKAPEERYSLWFDMHPLTFTRDYGKQAGFGDAQERWLEKEHPFPILMPKAYEQFPSVQPYPIKDVIAAAGRDYFTSTVAYAIALAASMDDVAEIGLWGIDLVHDTEYGDQRPCAEYHIRAAEDRGIKVTIHERSALLRQRCRYGYEPEDPLVSDLRNLIGPQVKGLDAAIKASEQAMEKARGQAQTDDGARQALMGILQRLEIWERGGRV